MKNEKDIDKHYATTVTRKCCNKCTVKRYNAYFTQYLIWNRLEKRIISTVTGDQEIEVQ